MKQDKANIFVAHIQRHLDNGDNPTESAGTREIPAGKVGCKICEKSIDRIYSEELRKAGSEKK